MRVLDHARVALALGIGVTIAATAVAGGSAERVVANIDKHAITVAHVEQMFEKMPRYQLRLLGPDADTIRARFVEQIVRMELLSVAGEANGLAAQADVRARIDSVLLSAMHSELTDEIKISPVLASEVKAYYDSHRDRYQSEERIKIWQIVVATKAQADAIMQIIRDDPNYKKDPVKAWGDLARKHSTDKATAMRRGNLGFVRPDGSTAHKHLKVDPTLYQAAAKIGDGTVFPAPVPLGIAYVVLQRRGSHRTPQRSLATEAKSISGLLEMQRKRAAMQAYIADLRQKNVTMVSPEKLSTLEMTFDGELRPRRRPGTLSERAARRKK